MNITERQVVSITEASQNFSAVALVATDEDVTEAGLGVASGAWTYEKLPLWVRGHAA